MYFFKILLFICFPYNRTYTYINTYENTYMYVGLQIFKILHFLLLFEIYMIYIFNVFLLIVFHIIKKYITILSFGFW